MATSTVEDYLKCIVLEEERGGHWARVPTGQIADGQTVLIDYVFTSGTPFKLDTVGQEASVRQNFDFGLSPYYRLRWQDQKMSPATSTGMVPADITANIVGAEFERWSLRLAAEYKDHESSINPLDAVRLEASYTRRLPLGATATVKARWTDMTFFLPQDHSCRSTGSGKATWNTIPPNLSCQFTWPNLPATSPKWCWRWRCSTCPSSRRSTRPNSAARR